jgi:hypothetical protein
MAKGTVLPGPSLFFVCGTNGDGYRWEPMGTGTGGTVGTFVPNVPPVPVPIGKYHLYPSPLVNGTRRPHW